MAFKAPLGYTTGLFAVTKSDATVYSPPLESLYIGGAGAVAIVQANDEAVTLTALAVGVVHNIGGIKKIMSTGTTATLIVAGR
jgi:hypothetical protein